MRAANVAAVAALLLGAAAAEAQLPRERAVIRRSEWNSPESRGHVHHPEPAGPRHFDPHDLAHGGVGGTGSPYGYSYAPFLYPYGYGYGFGYEGVYGPGLSYYRGPAPFSGINPPIYVFPPVGYGFGYGGYGFGGYGYGSAWYPVGPDPLNNRLLQEQYDSDWARLSAELADRALKNVDDPRPGTTAVPVPSTPEAKLKSLRYQAQGDEAFANQDYAKALDRYKAAASAAKDDGRAYFKAGYAFVALGRFASAIEYFKRGLAVEPALAAIGPTPDELYGDHQLAWTAHLGRVTRWVREDIRDAQRVFLLGLLLHFDGDTRAREFLEKAWQLSGGTEAAVVTLLSPPKVEGVRVVE
ncbi:MAG TPA: tetratricopeptide repeat protein, partial [Planctomycetaceae bacterium]